MTSSNHHPNFLYGNAPLPLGSADGESAFRILPIPMEKTTSFMKGTIEGPQRIIEVSDQLEFFDPELNLDISEKGILTDWTFAREPKRFNEPSSEQMVANIQSHVEAILTKYPNQFILSIGGEHTITAGCLPPIAKKYQDQITLLHFDAHLDLKDSYDGTKYSHACAIRRVCEYLPVVSVGIRSVDEHEYTFAKESSQISAFYAHDIAKNQNWIEEVLEKINTPYTYISFDLDGFDPSVIPGLGTPQPGGLQWYPTLDLIRRVSKKSKIVSADVNEICPDPQGQLSAFVAATLIYKIMNYSVQI